MSEWKFDVDEVGDDADEPDRDDAPEMEPGSPSLENAAFVLLGALSMLFVLVRLVTLV
ncbi:DUF7312 domain-containing protein [Halomicrococcus sp. SG-WS-1]|uniref:DUF7312 domain-containing protein n=1 Tax=Halomicrococcus sp. SG-WS-1 TaxID=3439057 RepID=UPI0026913602